MTLQAGDPEDWSGLDGDLTATEVGYTEPAAAPAAGDDVAANVAER